MWRSAVLIGLCALMFLTGLGRTAIEDSDEAYYAESAREMVASGDWTTPHYNFEPRLQKPVLVYWLIAAAYSIAGVSETAARLPSALAGAGLALLAFAIARRWMGAPAGLLAGVIVATSFGVVPLARESLPDTPLAFFVTLTIWASIEALTHDGARAQSNGARRLSPFGWLCIAALASALGMLTKGPVAIALPVTVIAPLGWREWRAGRLRRLWVVDVTGPQFAAAVALFLLVAAPWYIAVTRAQGLEYLSQFFIGENLDRFATTQNNSWRGHQYLPIIIGGLLPWSAFMVFWFPSARDWLARRRRLTEIEARLLSWAAGPLAFFMVSIGNQPRYILPCLVPIAILLARTIWNRASQAGAQRDWRFIGASVAGGLTIVAAGVVLMRASALLQRLGVDTSAAGPIVLVVAGGLIVVSALFVARQRIPLMIAAGAAASILAVETHVFAIGRPEPVEVIAAAVRADGPVDSVCACDAFARSLNFYTHVKTVGVGVPLEEMVDLIDQPHRTLAAIDSRSLARVEAQLARTLPRLAEVRYLNAGPSSPAAIFVPNPDDVQTVYLVSNGR